jgi:hypothetical protein
MSTPQEAVEDSDAFLKQKAKNDELELARAEAIRSAKPQVEKLYFYVTQPAGPSFGKMALWVVLFFLVIWLISSVLAPKIDGKYTDGMHTWRILSWPKFGDRDLIIDGPERIYGKMSKDGAVEIDVHGKKIFGQWSNDIIKFNDQVIFKRLY